MDGDVVPLREISELCRDHDALLVLDEAHAAVGPDHVDVPGLDVLHVGTLSKTLGALGGFVAGSKSLVDLLVNRARTFIFTTGLSPADTAAALAALRICRSAEGDALRTRLRALIDILRPGHPSAVIPVILGDDEHAVRGAAILRERGLYVPAIRPPTVAPGTSRLRVALSAAHTPEMVMELRDALAELTTLPDAISA
jgi:7-keto-8-aminopelargonate synthetase-like enzyme